MALSSTCNFYLLEIQIATLILTEIVEIRITKMKTIIINNLSLLSIWYFFLFSDYYMEF